MNHVGSLVSMEGAVIAEILSHSVQKHKLSYSRLIGDGDTNTFKVVSESKPYGEDVAIQKDRMCRSCSKAARYKIYAREQNCQMGKH